ncbi:MAG: hypothetical protein KC933_08550 [Myxococcales bacterium]|nr:hypothetical protein [Myxococcales bacterium]
MKRFWLVGALSLAALACDPNTKPTDTVRNNTYSSADEPGWTISAISVRVAVDDAGELLAPGAAGEYGANILSGDLAPNSAAAGETPSAGSEQSISALDCNSYDVKVTVGGVDCELTDEQGTGPRYLCFSQHRWDISADELGDCGF